MAGHRIKYLLSFFPYVLSSVFIFLTILIQTPLALADTPASLGDEAIVWERAPIIVTLPIGKERFVSFPSAVQLGYDKNRLPDSVLRVENDHQTLYLMARKSFPITRVEVKLATGEIILMDISATDRGDDNPIDVVFPKFIQSIDTSSYTSQGSYDLDYVSLTRYAIQQLYAPTRLLTDSSTIIRFPMQTTYVVPLFYDGSVSSMPLASWRQNNNYVTALLVKNRLHELLRLDPRLLCGDWKAATFFPQETLASQGTPIDKDTSTLFVVSDRPFSEAMSLCIPA